MTSLGWRPACRVGPCDPRLRLGLLEVESLGNPACTGRLPAAVGRRFAEGQLGSRCPHPAFDGLPAGCPPMPRPPPPPRPHEVGVPFLAPAVTPSWAGVWGVWVAAMPSWAEGRKAEGGAEVLLLDSRSGSGVCGWGGGSFGRGPPSASLNALLRLCWCLAPSAAPCHPTRA